MRPSLRFAFWLLLLPVPPQLVAQQVSSFRIAETPGESLHVVRAGSGQPLVVLPGLFGCAFGFRHLLGELSRRGNRITVIEPLAVGSSSRPEHADYSLTGQADRIAAVLPRLESTPVLLVAHSASGSIALRLAIRHPQLVRGVVLLEGGPVETVATKGFRQAMRYAPWVKWMGGMKRLRPYIRRDLIASSTDSSWLTDRVLEAYTAGAAADLDGTLKAYLRMADAREPEKLAPRLQELTVPVRLVLGAGRHKGGISPEQIHLLTTRVPTLTVDSVPRAGHYLFEEAPEAVVAAIVRAQAASLASRSTVSRP
jgi:pimeloyl-ACP methyl ester carboxylesterase